MKIFITIIKTVVISLIKLLAFSISLSFALFNFILKIVLLIVSLGAVASSRTRY